MPTGYTRRRLLQVLSAAGAAGIAGAPHILTAAEALETTTVRIVNDGSICIAPLFAAEELLRAEGFADIRYVKIPADGQVKAVADGKLDFATSLLEAISLIDSGTPIAVLAGIHVGCIELFANEGIRVGRRSQR